MEHGHYGCEEELERINKADCIPWERLRGRTVLITGGTGLIGTALIRALAYCGRERGLGIEICLLVRDADAAKVKLKPLADAYGNISFYQGEVEVKTGIGKEINYVIHGASPTDSGYFIQKPVETIKTAVIGTMNMLELAREKKAEGFAYLSSMEVYGETRTDERLSEADVGYLDPLRIRSCYPEGKRMCESLVACFAGEYGLPARSVRLAQTIGPGIRRDDKRVFAEFARCALEKRDIELLTDGSSKRCYLYTMDAASAILTVLLKGEPGASYNAANPGTYCSIREMAEMVAGEFGNGAIGVKIGTDKSAGRKFSLPHCYNLDTSKLEGLGWRAGVGLREMYARMMEGMQR